MAAAEAMAVVVTAEVAMAEAMAEALKVVGATAGWW